MALFNKTGTSLVLNQGVTISTLEAEAVLFITKLAEVAKHGDDITIAHLLILQSDGWKPALKKNLSGLEAWMNSLYQGNKTMYSRCNAWLKRVAGLSAEIRDKEGEDSGTYAVISVDKEADANKLGSAFDAALMAAAKEGILYQPDKVQKAPKERKPSSKPTAGSNVIEVPPSQVLAEKLGLAAALDVDSKETERLAEVAQYIVRILEHAKHNPDRNNLKALLESTCKKLDNGFNLASAMAKAVA